MYYHLILELPNVWDRQIVLQRACCIIVTLQELPVMRENLHWTFGIQNVRRAVLPFQLNTNIYFQRRENNKIKVNI